MLLKNKAKLVAGLLGWLAKLAGWFNWLAGWPGWACLLAGWPAWLAWLAGGVGAAGWQPALLAGCWLPGAWPAALFCPWVNLFCPPGGLKRQTYMSYRALLGR